MFFCLIYPAVDSFSFQLSYSSTLVVLFYISDSLLETCNFSLSTSILFLSSWIIFTIITLNSFSKWGFPISTSLSCSSWILFCSFTWSMFYCHLILFKFLYFYICGRWHFLTLVMWPSIGDVLCDPSCNPRARDQLVQGRFWPVFADSVPQAVGLYISCFWCLPPGGWSRSRGSCRLPGVRGWCLPTGGGVVSWPSGGHD